MFFPIIQSIHIIALTVLVGTIAIVDLRMLGFGIRRRSVSQLAVDLAPWTWLGLVTVLITGPLLFWSDLPRYVKNPAFIVKMVVLALALIDHFTIHRHAAKQEHGLKLAAVLSLALWIIVILAGRAIADFDVA